MKNLEWSSKMVFPYLGGGEGTRNLCVRRHPEKLMKKECDRLSEEGFKQDWIGLFLLFLFSTNTRFRYTWVIWRIQNRNLPPSPCFPLFQSPREWPQLCRMCCCSYCNYMDSSQSDVTCSCLMLNHLQNWSGRKLYTVPLPRSPVRMLGGFLLWFLLSSIMRYTV